MYVHSTLTLHNKHCHQVSLVPPIQAVIRLRCQNHSKDSPSFAMFFAKKCTLEFVTRAWYPNNSNES